ncbi:uncharacterized protein C8A04DRAFT_36774 [Dichotomopilus funicola]|uniref:DUF1279 domain-containing protein n=1 Tax=Dichotomopilus funicola TaxID=1934379 RepID=A0AAN6V3R3_9PEZI|nr:hypothetical protein C8A04DRAFT_36774 [Dichotomopilus funicola]
MLRTSFSVFDALVFGRGTAVRHTSTTILRNVAVRSSPPRTGLPWARSFTASAHAAPTKTSPLSGGFRLRRPFHTTRPRRTADTAGAGEATAEEGSLSLSARLKKLSREYGWSAVGVYLALSVLDFPFCFLLVRTVGTEKIAHLEEIVIRNVQKIVPDRLQAWWVEYRQALKDAKRERVGEVDEVIGHGVAEAELRNNEGASLATQLALAYAIHKSFIFLRVPLTAAVTPKVVKVLRSWGWQIGKNVKKAKA